MRDNKHFFRLIHVFAIAYAVLLISPALFSRQFPPYPLLKWGDVTDILTPLILVPLYWLLVRLDRDEMPPMREMIAFLIFSALWVEGQGMHLGANSIGHVMKQLKSTDAYALTYFYDEGLSHYLWHGGVIALSALLIWRQWHNPFTENSSWHSIALAAFIYGATYFITTIEAGTALIGLPFAVVVAIIGLFKRNDIARRPLAAFFIVSYIIATILFAAWGIYWRGLPQFSEVGIIE